MQAPVMKEANCPTGSLENPLVGVVVDTVLLTLSHYDALMRLVDFRKVKSILASEVDRVGDGPVHLTPLFVYLHAIARNWYATGDATSCTRDIAAALEAKGVRARLPDALRGPFGPATGALVRNKAARKPLARQAPVGTRAHGGRVRSPKPTWPH